eukprot:3943483-Amphidinium_carterae.1
MTKEICRLVSLMEGPLLAGSKQLFEVNGSTLEAGSSKFQAPSRALPCAEVGSAFASFDFVAKLMHDFPHKRETLIVEVAPVSFKVRSPIFLSIGALMRTIATTYPDANLPLLVP